MYGMISVIENALEAVLEVAAISDSLLPSAPMPRPELVDGVALEFSEEPRPEGEPGRLARIVTAAIVLTDQVEHPLEEGVAQELAVGLIQRSGCRRARDDALDQALDVVYDLVLAKRRERRAGLGDPPYGEQHGHQAASPLRTLRWRALLSAEASWPTWKKPHTSQR